MGVLVSRVKAFKAARARLAAGNYNCIPFKPYLPDLSKAIPGLIRGTYWAITSFSNVGKTPLAKYLFVLIPHDFKIQHKPDLNLKILYFALEESKAAFFDSIICAHYADVTGENIDVLTLNGYSDKPVNPEMFDVLEGKAFHNWFESFESCVEVVSHLTSVKQIADYIDNFAKNRGEYVDGRYKPNDPNEYVIVVVDHINLLDPENTNLMDQMAKWSNYALQEGVKKFNYIMLNVQQQAAEGENAVYNKFNQNAASLATLGDNKKTARDYHVVLGLDMPQRYEAGLREHCGYKLTEMSNPELYRNISGLKNRFGRAQFRKGVELNPYSLQFKELVRKKQN